MLGMATKDLIGIGRYAAYAGIAALLCLALAIYHRRKSIIQYDLGDGMLVLRRGKREEKLALEKVLDANLIDLRTARDYVQEHAANAPDQLENADVVHLHDVVRFCALPIMKGRSDVIVSTLMGGTLDNLRKDLVLLRIRDGGAYLLSPRYCELLVSSIAKAKQKAVLVDA